MPRILCVEDDADIQHIIGQVLFRQGYDVHYAWNGKEGYEKVIELDPDLLLIDLMLPLVNGLELLKKVKQNKATRDIPAVIVTAFGDEADMLKYALEALGAEGYLRKPIQLPELVRIIKQVLLHCPRKRGSFAAKEAAELRKGCMRADRKFSTIWINDRLVATLPHKEFVLFQFLLESPGPARKDALLQALGYDAAQSDALKQAIHRLRVALGPEESRRIKTTPQGYELIC